MLAHASGSFVAVSDFRFACSRPLSRSRRQPRNFRDALLAHPTQRNPCLHPQQEYDVDPKRRVNQNMDTEKDPQTRNKRQEQRDDRQGRESLHDLTLATNAAGGLAR